MEDGMQTVTPGASHLEVTPIAYGTWQFGGDWESVDEQAAMAGLVREGLTRHVGVSNYSTDQITEFAAVLSAETVQPPYHLFRRDIEADLLPYARAHHIGVLAYRPLAHGLLGGTITEATAFGGDDWRSHSPAFTGPGFWRNLEVVAAPGRSAADRSATIAQLAVAWALAHPAVQVAIVGSRPLAPISRKASAPSISP
jgi:aryl-alcohol dehydrogenase-like predicted oxidoreductase